MLRKQVRHFVRGAAPVPAKPAKRIIQTRFVTLAAKPGGQNGGNSK